MKFRFYLIDNALSVCSFNAIFPVKNAQEILTLKKNSLELF